MNPITIVLPVPPSTNKIWAPVRTRGGAKLVKRGSYDDWMAEAKREVTAQRGTDTIPGAFRVAIVLPEDMRGDGDNRIKPALDACQHGGAIANDKDCIGGSWDFEPRATVLVQLTPIPPIGGAPGRTKGTARMETTS